MNSSFLELRSPLDRLEILGAKVTLYDAMFSKYGSNGELEEQVSQEGSTKDLEIRKLNHLCKGSCQSLKHNIHLVEVNQGTPEEPWMTKVFELLTRATIGVGQVL